MNTRVNDEPVLLRSVEATLRRLVTYCRVNDWSGYDPYDALNSRLFAAAPVLDSRFPRIAVTQLLKRSPINLRPLLQIPKTQNPKAVALFICAFLKSPELSTVDGEDLIDTLTHRLIALRSVGTPYWCWGYSFAWQTRTIIVERAAPNLVCTTFVAGALLDLYEEYGRPEHLAIAVSAADYMLNELYWTDGELSGFAYPLPSVRVQVHNANLLAAALLCRLYRHTTESRFLAPALKMARYSAEKQRPDGSWYYGEAPTQRWIDNFHTGYNLGALHRISQYLDTEEFEPYVVSGLKFYRDHFFREDGAARYFHDRT